MVGVSNIAKAIKINCYKRGLQCNLKAVVTGTGSLCSTCHAFVHVKASWNDGERLVECLEIGFAPTLAKLLKISASEL